MTRPCEMAGKPGRCRQIHIRAAISRAAAFGVRDAGHLQCCFLGGLCALDQAGQIGLVRVEQIERRAIFGCIHRLVGQRAERVFGHHARHGHRAAG